MLSSIQEEDEGEETLSPSARDADAINREQDEGRESWPQTRARVHAYVRSKNLLCSLPYADAMAQLVSTSLELPPLAPTTDQFEFWDKRVWPTWKSLIETRWEMSLAQLSYLKAARSQLASSSGQEDGRQPPLPPALLLDFRYELLLSRRMKKRGALGGGRKSMRVKLKPEEMPNQDAEMTKLFDFPTIKDALDLKLSADKNAIELLKSQALSSFNAHRRPASPPTYSEAPVAPCLPLLRVPSPPLFPRTASTQRSPMQLHLTPVSLRVSPFAVNMEEWNTVERIRHPSPSTPLPNPSKYRRLTEAGDIYSTPLKLDVPSLSAAPEKPLFPRARTPTCISSSFTPLPTIAHFDDLTSPHLPLPAGPAPHLSTSSPAPLQPTLHSTSRIPVPSLPHLPPTKRDPVDIPLGKTTGLRALTLELEWSAFTAPTRTMSDVVWNDVSVEGMGDADVARKEMSHLRRLEMEEWKEMEFDLGNLDGPDEELLLFSRVEVAEQVARIRAVGEEAMEQVTLGGGEEGERGDRRLVGIALIDAANSAAGKPRVQPKGRHPEFQPTYDDEDNDLSAVLPTLSQIDQSSSDNDYIHHSSFGSDAADGLDVAAHRRDVEDAIPMAVDSVTTAESQLCSSSTSAPDKNAAIIQSHADQRNLQRPLEKPSRSIEGRQPEPDMSGLGFSLPSSRWSSVEALARLVRARRGRTSSAASPSLEYSKSAAPIVPPVRDVQQTPPVLPVPSGPPLAPPEWLNRVITPSTAPPLRIIASESLLQMRPIHTALTQTLELVDRPPRFLSIDPHTILEPHLILDGQTCVLFRPLRALAGNVFRADELTLDGSVALTRHEAIVTTLLRFSTSFQRVLLVLEETPTLVKRSPYTPPVCTALLALDEALKANAVQGFVVDVAVTCGSEESAETIRKLLNHLGQENAQTGWEDRSWLIAAPSEAELNFVQIPELNHFSASMIAACCLVEDFVALSAEARRATFGHIIGHRLIDLVSARMTELQQYQPEMDSSPPLLFIAVDMEDRTFGDAKPHESVFAEFVQWPESSV